MKSAAFAIALCIAALGAVGIVIPSVLVSLCQPFATAVDWYWYAVAGVRAAFGVLLLLAAKGSRAPKSLRVVALIPILAALAIPLVGVERSRATMEWWLSQGPGVVRLTALPLLALGGFVAYACAPTRRGEVSPRS